MMIDEDTLAQFKEMVKLADYSALDHWAPQMNPKVVNMMPMKRACLLTIASHGDQYGDRGRIHTLLEGAPGTAKSVMQMWIHHFLGGFFASHRTTDVGLTGDMRGSGGDDDEPVPGLLAQADDGIVCIDELDKFSPKDQAGLLEAMSDGLVTLTGGGHHTQFKANVRVIAGCNSVKKFSPELLDRFDFKFQLATPDKEKTCAIMDDRIDWWFREKDGYDGATLRKYLDWIKPFQPSIQDDLRANAKKLMRAYITLAQGDKGVRYYEGVNRVAYTIAKLQRRDMMLEDIALAIIELDPPMRDKFKQLLDNEMVNGGVKGPLRKVVYPGE